MIFEADKSRPLEAPFVVAIDGPSGVGKSSLAKALAHELGLPYLDTGAMYRSVGLEVLRHGVDPGSETEVSSLLTSLKLELAVTSETNRVKLLLNGSPVEAEIRQPAVALVTSQISQYSAVRRLMVERQRRFGNQYGGVMEGRDIGTVVFPDTPYKLFLDAAPQERARRRHHQLQEAGIPAGTLSEVAAALESRDRRDSERAESPLRSDSSYTEIDTTQLGFESVLALALRHVKRLRRPSASAIREGSAEEPRPVGRPEG